MSIKYGYNIDLNSNSTAAKVLNMVGKCKKVLEVGCSYGYMSKILKENLNCYVVGIEIDEESYKISKNICDRTILGSIEDDELLKNLKNEQFDVIIFADVLEHLSNPDIVLRKIKSLLKPSGEIIISIPNISYISVILELINDRFEYRNLGILDNTHIKFFTKSSIISLLEKEGFQILSLDRTKINPIESEFNTILQNDEITSFIKRNNVEWDTYQYIIKAKIIDGKYTLNLYENEMGQLKKSNAEIYMKYAKLQDEKDILEKRFNELVNYVEHLEKDINILKGKGNEV